MRTLIIVGLLAIACGGSEDSAVSPYQLSGKWNVYATALPPVGTMTLTADLSAGTYTEGGVDYALTAHTFDGNNPAFSLTFGSKTITGTLIGGDSHSNLFTGKVDAQDVNGVRLSH